MRFYHVSFRVLIVTTHTDARARTQTRARTHTRTRTHRHADTRMHARSCTHADVLAHTHTQTYIRNQHTRTQTHRARERGMKPATVTSCVLSSVSVYTRTTNLEERVRLRSSSPFIRCLRPVRGYRALAIEPWVGPLDPPDDHPSGLAFLSPSLPILSRISNACSVSAAFDSWPPNSPE